MQFYNVPVEDVVSYFGSDCEYGIKSIDVKDRVNKYGKNVLVKTKRKGVIRKFISQFDNVMILILVFSSVVSFFLAFSSGNKEEFLEPIVILFIVFLNATLGVLQESKAEKTLEELDNMSALNCNVIRGGLIKVIKREDIVPGDIVILAAGDIVPADCRLVEVNGLKVDESFLTGESDAVVKTNNVIKDDVHSVGDITNMIFSGSSIMMGKCKAIVCSIGMETKLGKIASSLNDNKDNKAPIEKKLEVLSKYIGIGALILCVLIFFLGVLSGIKFNDMFMISISLAVAAIPEGLPALVTIVFALGVQKMAKKNAIVRKLPSVETLGSASVICTDKTGTLTENKLSLVKVYMRDSIKNVDDNIDDELDLLKYSLMCTSSDSDPIDHSIKMVCDSKDVDVNYSLLYEIPFDSNRKCMSVIVKYNGKFFVVTKGAHEVIKNKCKYVSVDRVVDEMCNDGLRVISVGYKEIDNINIRNPLYLERDLNFVGILAFKDKEREGVVESVKICKEAGIKPIMITGDYALTARSIARSVGIYNDNDLVMQGDVLHRINDTELYEKLDKISVYARVNPEDKIRIVKLWQRKGKVVAMTGDGVNDAPALKAADIGCAMGKNGTEVAKNASDLVLLDDNFSTIVESIKEGRNIYDNVKKSILFLLGTNMGEIFTMLFAMLFWQISPLISMQLLWVNLVTDIAPALAIGMEDSDEDLMKRSPKGKDEKILSFDSFIGLVIQGLFFSFLVLLAFVIGRKYNIEYARTMSFIVISLSQLFHAFNIRTDKPLYKVGILSNKYLVIATMVTLLLMSCVCFIPLFVNIFGLVILNDKHYVICIVLSLIPVLVSEVKKTIKKD